MARDKSFDGQGVGPVGIAGRGFLMGLAEVVPGVSGGTIAFITGIYPTLISSIASFGPRSVPMLWHWRRFVDHHQVIFLGWLALGMGGGVLLFAQLMQYLLTHFQPVVWGFFAGVILLSVIIIGTARVRAKLLVWAPLGIAAGVSMLWLPQAEIEPVLWQVFAGGAIAICAWLLPAVSGSFILLALGLYATVIHAVATLHWPVLFTFAFGCVAGVLVFSRLLAWLLDKHGEILLSFLTGFMLGSVTKLWPWQAEDTTGWDQLLTPLEYAHAQPAYLPWVLVFAMLGALGIWVLSKFSTN